MRANKVKSLSPNHRSVIALHSPSDVVETGLRVCPSEKKARKLACDAQVLRSGLRARVAELRQFQAIFRGMQPSFSATRAVWRRGLNSITAIPSKSW